MTRAVRIANASGFWGDRRSALREMVEGGPVDVVTGDYLAELTMLILAGQRARDPARGYTTTFLDQLEEVLGTCVDRGIRVVTNAGGLVPDLLATRVRSLAERLGLEVAVAHVAGDDVLADLDAVDGLAARDRAAATTANAYLGGWGIAAALAAGADVVVTGRVTDASLAVGPAAWWHDWSRDDWDRLAGATVAGHVIECGAQATGGNHPLAHRSADPRPPGFPLVEVAADGTAVVTKHPDTGGAVTVDTVTAQLLYEVAGPAYVGPDVVTHLDTVHLALDGADRVVITGVRGSPPPATLKVGVTVPAGYRSTMTVVLTGLDVAAKAARVEQMLVDRLGGREHFDDLVFDLLRFDRPDAPSNPLATAHLRITACSTDRDRVDREFTDAVVEQALSGVAGFHATTPPPRARAFGVFRSGAIARDRVQHAVVLADGSRHPVADPPTRADRPDAAPAGRVAAMGGGADVPVAASADLPSGPTRAVPLGEVCGARSGDKGGDANIGVWAHDDAGHAWLRAHLTVDRVRDLLGPEAADLAIERHDLPTLRAVNVVVHGLLGDGVAATARPDAQAKGLAEYLRSRVVDVPVALLDRPAAP